MKNAREEALSLAKFAKGHIGPHEQGAKLIDTFSEDKATAYLVAMYEKSAIVVYEDDPGAYVSCDNQPGRWATT